MCAEFFRIRKVSKYVAMAIIATQFKLMYCEEHDLNPEDLSGFDVECVNEILRDFQNMAKKEKEHMYISIMMRLEEFSVERKVGVK